MDKIPPIYLDYAATTPLDPRVLTAMLPYLHGAYGNPSSQHSFGRAARAALDSARDTVADILGARSSEIIFTSGGTEANNMALKGVAHAAASRGQHLITTAFEHHAVLGPCNTLAREGFQITYLRPDDAGYVTAAQVAAALTPATTLVSVIYANNEIGTIQPIANIAASCHENGVYLHTDAVQAAGELPLNVDDLGVDLLSLSAHKIYGPKGVGALYVRSGIRLQPQMDGGGQEMERRAGTEAVAAIVGFATALQLAHDASEISRQRHLRDTLIDALLALPGITLNGGCAPRLSNNVNVSFAGIPGETMLQALDLSGIAVSTGAACSAGAVEASHVLLALGVSPATAAEAVRFSLGRGVSAADIQRTISTVQQIVARLRGEGRG